MPDPTPNLLALKDVHRTFTMGTKELRVLKGIDFELKEGEFASISGSSGAGKSTLLHILGLLDRPDSGTYTYQGRDFTRLDNEEMARVRNKEFGFVFQFFHLLPEFTALENVMIPGRLGTGGFNWLRKSGEIRSRAEELLDHVGLKERMKHLPTQLSGGERQRVAIARALVNEPSVVFCDEPTGNLDSATADSVFNLLRQLNADGQTFLIVTHDDDIAARADTRYVMKDGLFVERSASETQEVHDEEASDSPTDDVTDDNVEAPREESESETQSRVLE